MSFFSNADIERRNTLPWRCSECDQPCDVMIVDNGIGAYEYHGMRGVDKRPEAVSDCCEAAALDEHGHTITLQDLED